MNTIHKTRRRAAFAAALAIIGAGGFVLASSSPAAAIVTGASAQKDCPVGPYNLGDNIPCVAQFMNTGDTVATVVGMTEQAPWFAEGDPANGPFLPLSCTILGGQVISAGSSLAPATNCAVAFNVPIPNDPALCNSFFTDRVGITLRYSQPPPNPPLSAGAFATNTVFVQCLPDITITKTADPLSKVGDPVNYSIEICNVGDIAVTKTSVDDSLAGDIAGLFGAGLAPGQCESANYSRDVQPGDPDQLINTVTAIYSGDFASDTATADALTNLFQPGVDVQKECVPPVNEVGGTSTCTIIITNTSSGDSPDLVNGTISDTLTGDLLDGTNPAIVSSDCATELATGASCTIVTTDIIEDPSSPVVNTVTVHYNPSGFPNDITDEASASVIIVAPSITVVKTADALGKVTDPVDYTVTVCNTGQFPVAPNFVTDTLQGDITGLFDPLDPGQCQIVGYSRVVQAGDADPLINTVTANYGNAGGATAQASASATTDLFQPSVDVTKECQPNPVTVGTALVCTIGVTNTSSATTPTLTNGTITDTLAGNLLALGNPQVTSSTCTGSLAVGASCQITTSRIVLGSDPNPLVNTVTVNYNPTGFPNNIGDTASASVPIEAAGEGCTPGYWRQDHHFDSWTVYSPTDRFNTVFGVTIVLQNGKKAAITNPTLLQAVWAEGGGINALARHAVAALLNSTSPGTDSPYTTAEVIAIVQSAVNPGGLTIEEAHILLAAANELGCDLN